MCFERLQWEASPHLSSKHTLLHLIGDDIDGLIETTILSKTGGGDDDGSITLLPVGEKGI